MSEDQQERASIEQAVEAATRDEAESARLRQRLETARAAQQGAEGDVTRVRASLVDESADVDALESFSPTRIWASLRGRRDADLERERAELQRAEYAMARALARLRDSEAEVKDLEGRMVELGDVGARLEQALAAKGEWLARTGSAEGAEVSAATTRLGVLRSERTELEEALRAARAAHENLQAAVALLEKASSWSSWDTFGGGGLITDSIKYDRMDQAASALGAADRSLRVLAGELADVDLPSVREVGVSGSLRAFDVWFDNIFSDWAVGNRIRDALDAARDTRLEVSKVGRALGERLDANTAETDTLERRRRELLA